MSVDTTSIEQLAINTMRTLSMDAVQAANSGHPGTPMALAPVAYRLWSEHLKYDPTDPDWPSRDRFVLSCGHASMLLYSQLHVAGVSKDGKPAITLDDIRNFRQLGSPCAGHPESKDCVGAETTTGPLGQGAGNSVGMAIAERWLAAKYNKPNLPLFDYNVYALTSDGDLMEGVACEAASLAGHLKLSNLCWIYDDNRITIEGDTSLAFTEDVATRFEGLGWNVIAVDDANDLAALGRAYDSFAACEDGPTLIIVRSQIGYGAPNKQGTAGAHGAPLGEDEITATKAAYDWPHEKFTVPPEVTEHFAEGLGKRGAESRDQWHAMFEKYQAEYPELAQQITQMLAGELPTDWDKDIPAFETDAKGFASRVSSGKVLNGVAKNVPWLIGGSADLAPSTMTLLTDEKDFAPGSYEGRNMHFGIREHGMAAILNGMALSHVRPYGATFFVFSDYLRPSMRLSALMELPAIYVFTHDSIGLGEDGPTHQPIEHLAAARAIPGLIVVRPADGNEVAETWRAIMPIRNRPVAFVLTRQNIATLDRTNLGAAAGVARGAYVLQDCDGTPDVILIGTGSEVSICLEAAETLAKAGKEVRVVSMPSWEMFDEQDDAYRESVLPPTVSARVAVEAGIEQGWSRYLGLEGEFVGLSAFGASAPAGQLYEHFGVTAENVVAAAKKSMGA